MAGGRGRLLPETVAPAWSLRAHACAGGYQERALLFFFFLRKGGKEMGGADIVATCCIH